MIELTESQLDLVRLGCTRCHDRAIPTLLRTASDASMLGAYCAHCGGWIKWVPQNSVWLSLEQQQKQPHDTITTQENEWITALADMGRFCWNQAEASGFHDGRARQPLELCMLVVTELAELAEAFRKGQADKPSDHIPEFTYAEEEWADVLVRVFDHSHDHVDPTRLGQAFVAKLAYNRTRGYRHGGKTV